jgi:hypothetical protein
VAELAKRVAFFPAARIPSSVSPSPESAAEACALVVGHEFEWGGSVRDDGIVARLSIVATRGAAEEIRKSKVWLESLREKQSEAVTAKYKTVDRKINPAPGVTPENAKTIRNFPENPLDSLPAIPLIPPPFKDGRRVTKNRLEKLNLNANGFLSAEELRIFEYILLVNENAIAFDESEKGKFRDDYFSPYIIPTMPHVPWAESMIPIPPSLRDQVNQLLREKIKNGTYERTESTSYRSRWFTVKKKNGKVRIVHNLEPLNAVAVKDIGLPPDLDEFAEGFAGRSIYSAFDVFSGFDNRKLAVESRDLTTFETRAFGTLRLTVLPQGYSNSPSEFQRCMLFILQDEIPDPANVFIDDLGVKGPPTRYEREDGTQETIPGHPEIRRFVWEHALDVNRILHRVGHAGATVSGDKIQLAREDMVMVGQRCTYEGRIPDTEKVDKILRWPVPRNATELRGFLGTCAVVRIWIKDYSKIAKPLSKLTSKDTSWDWGDEEQDAMEQLKALVTQAPCLKPIDYRCGRTIILAVDSSKIAVGFILFQIDQQGRKRPARYGSLTFNDRESRYSQPKLELYGIFRALKKWRHLLIGVKDFILETDARYIKGMLNAPDEIPNATLNRWIEYILLFTFKLRHVPAKEFGAVDGLSRRRRSDDSEDDDEYDSDREIEGERPRLIATLELAGEKRRSSVEKPLGGEEVARRNRMVPLGGPLHDIEDSEDIDERREMIGQEEGRTYEEKEKEEQRYKTKGRKSVKGWSTDEEIERVKKFLKTLERPEGLNEKETKSFLRYARQFFLGGGGELYRRGRAGEMHQRVVERGDRARVLRGIHEEMGHRGLFVTRRLLTDRYWWPEVYADVEMWVRGCKKCQIFSDRKITLPITPSSPSQLFRKFHIDVMHMDSSNGCKYIVLARDAATTYVEGRMLRAINATALARFLMEDIITRWGAIEEIATDNGKEFGAATTELARRYSINHIRISAYNSRAQGIVEQGNHTFRRALLKSCGQSSNWARYFHHALWVDRATVRKATGYSPFYLAHGYHPLLPIDAFQLSFAWNSRPITTEDLIAERIKLLADREEAEEEALEKIRKSRWKNKERFEREHKNTLFRGELKPGQLVLVRNSAVEKELDRKHKPRWLGPYVVVRRTKGGSYVLAQEDGAVLRTRFAAFRVIPYHQRDGLSFDVTDFVEEEEVEWEEEDEDEEPEELDELRREAQRRARWREEGRQTLGEGDGRRKDESDEIRERGERVGEQEDAAGDWEEEETEELEGEDDEDQHYDPPALPLHLPTRPTRQFVGIDPRVIGRPKDKGVTDAAQVTAIISTIHDSAYVDESPNIRDWVRLWIGG